MGFEGISLPLSTVRAIFFFIAMMGNLGIAIVLFDNVAFGQLTSSPSLSDVTALSNVPNNNLTSGTPSQTAQGAEGGYIIKMLHFYEDGTGWLTTSYDDSINACKIWFNHTLTPANGHYYTMGSGQISGIDFEKTPLSEIITSIDYRNCEHIPIRIEFVRGQTNWNGDALFEKQQYEEQQSPPLTTDTTTPTPMVPVNPNSTSVTGTPRPLTAGTPTTDPDLTRFNQIAAQCAQMVNQMNPLGQPGQEGNFVQPGQYGINSFEQCIGALKDGIHKYCEAFDTYDAQKCAYINTPQMQMFLNAADRIVGYGSALNSMTGQSGSSTGGSSTGSLLGSLLGSPGG